MADPLLQNAVRRQSDRIFDPLGFEEVVNVWIGEARVSPKINARELAAITRHDRLQHIFPAIGAVDIAGAQGASFQIAELVEDEQRMIAGAFVMAVQTLISCSPYVGLTLESISRRMALGGRRA